MNDFLYMCKFQMIVEEMNILTTVFLRNDNRKIIYPNSVLSTKTIGNFFRSPDMGDSVDFCIHVSTPVEKVAAMKERIKGYVTKPTSVLLFVFQFPRMNYQCHASLVPLYKGRASKGLLPDHLDNVVGGRSLPPSL